MQKLSQRNVLVLVCAGVVLASLDLFIVNVALPDMAADFHGSSLADMSWALNAYAIVYAALLLVFGRLSDGHRRDLGFLLGLGVFTAGSALCAAAWSLGSLVAFRVVQAAGAALLTPTSLGLVLATQAPQRRQAAVRTWTAVGGAAAALGPIVGGLLVALSWRWVFLVNVPIGLVALAVGWQRLPAVAGHPVPRPDLTGAAASTLGVATLTLALVKGHDWGWTSAGTLVALAVALTALGAFVVHTRSHHNPLVDPDLFRQPAFRGAALALGLFSLAFGGMLLSIVLWAQGAWGWSALRSGLAIAPGPLMVPLFGLGLAGPLIARFGPGRVAAVGTAVFGAGLAWWALAMTQQPHYVRDMVPGMLATGIGVGLTLPTLMATATGALPPVGFAAGSAVVNTVRQVGLAVGVAVLVALLGGAPDLAAFQRAWWVFAGTSLLASASVAVLLRRDAPAEARLVEEGALQTAR